jgi:hypothetical protein
MFEPAIRSPNRTIERAKAMPPLGQYLARLQRELVLRHRIRLLFVTPRKTAAADCSSSVLDDQDPRLVGVVTRMLTTRSVLCPK